ncbi:MAG TPA: hypothetical protein ENJ82_04885, partial [Bacteroidetes bacterium]|nr:hypothetical protein [Bacteroidota bacterium]
MNRDELLIHPYPGLRPFLQEESEVFFGRESQIETLIQNLLDTHFLAVVGTSGSGKSSLARAGLFPALDDEFGDSRQEHFNVIKIRPGQDPFGDMARQLCGLGGNAESVDQEMQHAFTLTTLKRGPLGLQKWWEEHQISGRLLLFVDQFEEVFRFRSLDPNEAIRFVKMLIASAGQKTAPIFICLTMRSEFLGRCTEFRDLPEMINSGQYLIPRLRRNELRAAIEQPALFAGARLSPRLSTRLLNEVGDNPDQLPILQHALMRAFQNWQKDGKQKDPIDLQHLEAIGGLNAALGIHAEEIYEKLAEAEQAAALALFRTISVLEGGVALRRPLRLDTVIKVTGQPADRIKNVIEAFRVADASFLLPGLPDPLSDESVVDISHESLIRRWPRLAHLVEEEAEDAKAYLRLSESAKRNALQMALFEKGAAPKPGEGYLISGMDLFATQALQKKKKLTEAWGKIQGDSSADFSSAISFLNASTAADAHEKKRKLRSRKLLRLTALAIGLLAIGMGIMAILAYSWFRDAKEAETLAQEQQEGLLSGYSKLLLNSDPTMNLCLLDYLVKDSTVQHADSLL